MDAEFVVDRLAVGGDGIAREPGGRVVFVRGALPGERVTARIASRGKDFWRAEVDAVIEPSPDRVSAPCPAVALGCGGCGWQHVRPASQSVLKAAMVRDALVRQGRIPEPQVRVGERVEPFGYRTTMRAAVARDGRLGLRRSSSHEIVTLDACPVAHPTLSSLLPVLRVRHATEVTLRVSEATGECTALPVGDGPQSPIVEGAPASLGIGVGASITERVHGRDLRVSAGSFFQSSARSAAILVDAVQRAVGERAPERCWADLYSGVGLFSASLFRDVPVVAVEREGSSTADARVNLVGRPADVLASDVERWRPQPCDVVVADPPRHGLGARAVQVVAATQARLVVLVSCDAAALGRDAQLLESAGYRHAGSEVLDLFPGTPHVEVVSAFSRSES